jgi:hypothetical protein
MNVSFALLADYTTTSKEDKFSVIGIYDRIGARSFPARHPQLQFAIRLLTTRADIGHDRQIMVDLVDIEGKTLQKAEGVISIPKEVDRPPTMNLVMIFENTVFKEPGLYNFNLFIDGRQEAAVPLNLEHIPDPATPPSS